MTVIFPILQTQIQNSSQNNNNVIIENNTSTRTHHDISEIYILPHDSMQFIDPYNTTVVFQKADNTQNLLNFTVASSNISSLYNFTSSVEPQKHEIQFSNKINYNISDQVDNLTYSNEINKQKSVLTADELELPPNFEITSSLKNYATVNVLEPIPTQISYNIGTESVGVDESIKNTESMTLEETSLISEIEKTSNIFDTITNANILSQKDKFVEDLFGTNDENFNSIFIEPKGTIEKDSNFIYPEVDLVDLNKQIRTTEAIEMSLVCEEETPSQWIDVMSLARNTTGLYEPPSIDENPLSAIPTAIQSYIDIESPKSTQNYQNNELYMFNESYALSEQTEKEIEGVIKETFEKINAQKSNLEVLKHPEEKLNNKNENLLKNLTAEANICSCTDCKCGPENTCNSDDTCYAAKNGNQSNRKVFDEPKSNFGLVQSVSNKNLGSKGCCDKNKSNTCSCTGQSDTECCIMVCLKSLDRLRYALSLANKCCSLQSLVKSFSSETCCNK